MKSLVQFIQESKGGSGETTWKKFLNAYYCDEDGKPAKKLTKDDFEDMADQDTIWINGEDECVDAKGIEALYNSKNKIQFSFTVQSNNGVHDYQLVDGDMTYDIQAMDELPL